MSFAVFSPMWIAAPPTSVSKASHQLKWPSLAATAIPSSIGTIVAVRNGRRVASRNVHTDERRGFTSSPLSAERVCR